MDPSTLTKRIARIRWEFTWLLRPWQAGLHRYLRNSHGSVDVDKEDCTDMLGIHMAPSTSTSRIAQIPQEFTRIRRRWQRGLHGYLGICMDSGTSIQTGLRGYPRNSHAICNFKLARNECRKQNSRILTGNVRKRRSTGVLPHPSSGARFVLQNTAFRALAISQKRISCETSLKNWKLKMWKRSFRARLPSKTESWRCEHEAFVRDFPQKVKVEVVKTKLSCRTSFKTARCKKSRKQNSRILSFDN